MTAEEVLAQAREVCAEGLSAGHPDAPLRCTVLAYTPGEPESPSPPTNLFLRQDP